jgi:hypothetical protein
MRPLQLSLWDVSAPREVARPSPLQGATAQAPAPVAPVARPTAPVAKPIPTLVPAPAPSGLALAQRLSVLLREPVDVELTDNAWTMVSYRRLQGRLCFRLHHMFAAADAAVVKAIAGFAGRSRKAAGHTIDDFIKEHRHLIKKRERRDEPALHARGTFHDLLAIYQRLNAAHFDNRVEARIGWGRRAPLRRRRSIKMGVYFHERRLIKVHPALDDPRVPRYFVEMVVFHEMLHQVVPPTEDAVGRRCVHSRKFRAAERTFPEYERARLWETANLTLLLRQRS